MLFQLAKSFDELIKLAAEGRADEHTLVIAYMASTKQHEA